MDVQQRARVFKALADPTRLQILDFLAGDVDQERTGKDIADALGITLALLCHHTSTLEDAGFDKSTDAATAQRLHAEASVLLPALADAQPIRHWAGLRPGSPDNIPIIGRHPDFDNVFLNVGHFRYGVTMAPAAAELLADLMAGTPPALDPAPYGWEAAVERHWDWAP